MSTFTDMEQAEDAFKEMLDSKGDIVICGITFSRSDILRNMDPIAYAEALDEFLIASGFDLD